MAAGRGESNFPQAAPTFIIIRKMTSKMSQGDIEILSRQIDCRNKTNSIAREISEKLKNFFDDYVGKKVVKVSDGNSFTAKLKKEVDQIICQYEDRNRAKVGIFFTFLYRSVYCNVKCSYQVSEYACDYVTREFFVFSFDPGNGMMTEEKREIGQFQTYSVDEVVATWEKIKEAERVVSALKSEVYEIKFRY
jgi:hypothetical protein